MMAAFAILLPSLAVASPTPERQRFEGMNQVYDVVDPGQSTTTIAYLGVAVNEDACQAACVGHRKRCWSYTYHSSSLSTDFAGQCFGITSPRWSPTPDVAGITSAKLLWPCRVDDDCSLNGVCSSAGTCACDAQWTGARCETLALTPATRGAGYRGVDGGANTSSWGGDVLLADDGTYHMWSAEMTEHCGIGAWAQNSRIIRATAKDLGSPFVREQVVWKVFSHEPMMARAPTGEYVMYFTSNRAEAEHGECDCCRAGQSRCDGSTGPGDCPSEVVDAVRQRYERRAATLGGERVGGERVGGERVGGERAREAGGLGDSSPTYMSYASAPEGPWSEPQAVFPHWQVDLP